MVYCLDPKAEMCAKVRTYRYDPYDRCAVGLIVFAWSRLSEKTGKYLLNYKCALTLCIHPEEIKSIVKYNSMSEQTQCNRNSNYL